MECASQKKRAPTLLSLPAEIRLQIYEDVIGSRIIHVRMKWTGICTPSGFSYACLDDMNSLLYSTEKEVLAHFVPFGTDFQDLHKTCRQIHRETVCLPFKIYTWAFETAFTLDQWVSMKSYVPAQHISAIRTVAVPTPGPYRSSERILHDLDQVLLVGAVTKTDPDYDQSQTTEISKRAILSLRKDKASNTWTRSGQKCLYAKDLF